ncbi:hypothetical protein BDZ89DRAFT_1066934 [Hymenopellis radicata]|nr:hypothetical protein BDZ89DRAFT_1066934 [Hymenopellis radicata]
MAPQPETVLLACEHKFHCIVGGETFSNALDAILKAHADSRCPCTLAGCDRAWISVTGPNDALPADAETVAMDDVVDMYEPPMVWFGSAWDIEPTDYALVNPHCKMNSSVSSGSRSSSYTFMPREAFIVVRPGLLRCGIDPNMPMRLPPSKVRYTNASRLNGVVWIDKTGAMDDMDRLGAPLSLIRRPSGFGKTCFAMMNLYYHSALLDSDMFTDMYSATKIMSSPFNLPSSSGRLGLLFDLAEVSDAPVEDFKGWLQLHVQSSIINFLGQYADLFKLDANTEAALPGCLEKNGFFCIEGIRHLIGASGWTVYVVIDNYNAPARAYNNNTRIAGLIDAILVRPLRDLGDLVYGGLILGEYMEGDDGDYCDDEDIWLAPSPWNQISEDYTRHSYVDAAFGLSVDEIAWLCKAVYPKDRLLLGKILRDVRGYQFGPDADLTYGTRDVVDAIRARTEGGAAAIVLK